MQQNDSPPPQTRWPTFVELCQYVIDQYVPKYGGSVAVMPLGAAGTTEMLLEASALFASKGMDWLSYYHQNGSIKFPMKDVGNWNTNDHGVNNAEGALRWPAVTYRLTGRQEDADQMPFALGMLDKYQGQVAALFCADEVFCGKAPHRGTETCTVVEAITSLAHAFEVLGTPSLMDRVERLAFNALPAALTADMWSDSRAALHRCFLTLYSLKIFAAVSVPKRELVSRTHVYVQNANSVFAGQTKAAPPTPPFPGTQPLQAHHLHHQHQTNKPCASCTGQEGDVPAAAAHVHNGDKPSGEDQGANFYGVSHFPCCITNFPQGDVLRTLERHSAVQLQCCSVTEPPIRTRGGSDRDRCSLLPALSLPWLLLIY